MKNQTATHTNIIIWITQKSSGKQKLFKKILNERVFSLEIWQGIKCVCLFSWRPSGVDFLYIFNDKALPNLYRSSVEIYQSISFNFPKFRQSSTVSGK